MKRFRMIALVAAAALALPMVAACGDAGATMKQAMSTPQGQADTLGTAWLLASTGANAYVAVCTASPTASICSEAVVTQVNKALNVGESAVADAKAAILAAGSDAGAMTKAVQIGMAAIDAFAKVVAAYALPTAATPPSS